MTEVTSDDSDYQDLSSEYEKIEEIPLSVCLENKRQKQKVYKVIITKSSNQIQLKIIQNQFYQVTLFKNKTVLRDIIYRRFSDFVLLFENLQRKNKGFIFPAFPQNGIFSYVRSKVSVTKDQFFIARRIKIIERFFNNILTYKKFDPQENSDIRSFFIDSQFSCIKKVQKQKASITDGLSWNKFKNFFYTPSPKQTQTLQELNRFKIQLQAQCLRFRQICELLKEEQLNTIIMIQKNLDIMGFGDFTKMLQNYMNKQKKNLNQAQQYYFQSFCLCEDIGMVRKILQQVEQLKQKEQNYKEIRIIERNFKEQLPYFKEQKRTALLNLQMQYQRLLKDISLAG